MLGGKELHAVKKASTKRMSVVLLGFACVLSQRRFRIALRSQKPTASAWMKSTLLSIVHLLGSSQPLLEARLITTLVDKEISESSRKKHLQKHVGGASGVEGDPLDLLKPVWRSLALFVLCPKSQLGTLLAAASERSSAHLAAGIEPLE